jgi:hypothetical protein
MLRHRRMQLLAAMEAAHEHDDERAEIERQLRELDEAIAGRTALDESEIAELERKLGGPIRRWAHRR